MQVWIRSSCMAIKIFECNFTIFSLTTQRYELKYGEVTGSCFRYVSLYSHEVKHNRMEVYNPFKGNHSLVYIVQNVGQPTDLEVHSVSSGVTRVQFSGGGGHGPLGDAPVFLGGGGISILEHFVSCSLKWGPIFSKFWPRLGGHRPWLGGGGGARAPHSYATVCII